MTWKLWQPYDDTKHARWSAFKIIVIRDNPTGSIYLQRWILARTPFGSLMVHKISRPDNDRHLHDHPWRFAALILKGGYVEEHSKTPSVSGAVDTRALRPGRINLFPLDHAHRIHELLKDEPVWTLVAAGPKRKEWGFWVPVVNGDLSVTRRVWVHWKQYLGIQD